MDKLFASFGPYTASPVPVYSYCPTSQANEAQLITVNAAQSNTVSTTNAEPPYAIQVEITQVKREVPQKAEKAQIQLEQPHAAVSKQTLQQIVFQPSLSTTQVELHAQHAQHLSQHSLQPLHLSQPTMQLSQPTLQLSRQPMQLSLQSMQLSQQSGQTSLQSMQTSQPSMQTSQVMQTSQHLMQTSQQTIMTAANQPSQQSLQSTQQSSQSAQQSVLITHHAMQTSHPIAPPTQQSVQLLQSSQQCRQLTMQTSQQAMQTLQQPMQTSQQSQTQQQSVQTSHQTMPNAVQSLQPLPQSVNLPQQVFTQPQSLQQAQLLQQEHSQLLGGQQCFEIRETYGEQLPTGLLRMKTPVEPLEVTITVTHAPKEGYQAAVDNDADSSEKRRRSKVANPKTWACNLRKLKHQRGEAYMSRRGKLVPPRRIKTTKDCLKTCKLKCSENINETDRQHIFQAFYSLNANEKKHFLLNTTERNCTKKPSKIKSEYERRRKYSFKYFFLVRAVRYTVCKNFYLGTLAISQKPVYNVHLGKSDMNIPKPDGRGLSEASMHSVPSEHKDNVRRHISSFRVLDAGMVIPASKKKQFLEPSLSIKKMYQMYTNQCTNESTVPVKESMYRKIFTTEFNLHFKKIKQEFCDMCKGSLKKK